MFVFENWNYPTDETKYLTVIAEDGAKFQTALNGLGYKIEFDEFGTPIAEANDYNFYVPCQSNLSIEEIAKVALYELAYQLTWSINEQ